MKMEKEGEEYELHTVVNLKIVISSVILMYTGTMIPFFFSNPSQIEWLAFIFGSALAVGGNIILLWGLKNQLLRFVHVKWTIPVRGTVRKSKERQIEDR